MVVRRVTTPAGDTWTVRRRWLARRDRSRLITGIERRRKRQRARRDTASDPRWYDAFDIPVFGDGFAALAVAALAVALLLVLLLFGWSIVLFGVSIVWVLLGSILGAVGRFVFGRPWWIEARSGEARRHWSVRGLRAAGRERDAIAQRFQHGHDPTPHSPTSPASGAEPLGKPTASDGTLST